jgi:hypothetical protein
MPTLWKIRKKSTPEFLRRLLEPLSFIGVVSKGCGE